MTSTTSNSTSSGLRPSSVSVATTTGNMVSDRVGESSAPCGGRVAVGSAIVKPLHTMLMAGRLPLAGLTAMRFPKKTFQAVFVSRVRWYKNRIGRTLRTREMRTVALEVKLILLQRVVAKRRHSRRKTTRQHRAKRRLRREARALVRKSKDEAFATLVSAARKWKQETFVRRQYVLDVEPVPVRIPRAPVRHEYFACDRMSSVSANLVAKCLKVTDVTQGVLLLRTYGFVPQLAQHRTDLASWLIACLYVHTGDELCWRWFRVWLGSACSYGGSSYPYEHLMKLPYEKQIVVRGIISAARFSEGTPLGLVEHRMIVEFERDRSSLYAILNLS